MNNCYKLKLLHQRRWEEIVQGFIESGREVIALSHQQIAQLCGNAIELQSKNEKIQALSLTAHATLQPELRLILEKSVRLLPLKVSAIELGGGSVRCMLAGSHLSARQQ
ncbi:MAG: hypothetical protein ACI965_001255 [Paraglaciecola sp.]|jgi:hypothetical protein